MHTKKIIIVMLFSMLFLSACSDQDKDALAEVYPKEIMDDDERKAADKSFEDPLADGTLTYQVMDCRVYDDIADAGIKKTDIRWPENMYADAEKTYEFQTLSDYMGEDGSLLGGHVFVTVDFRIENIDAVGKIKKKEFSVYNMAVWGGDPVNIYRIVYFSEAGKADAEQVYHYSLGQGERLDVRVGYLVLKEDTENMVGVVENAGVQFNLQ